MIARYCGLVWTACKLRKPHDCIRCHVNIEAGEAAWRPMTNGYDRMTRLCGKCGDGAVVEQNDGNEDR